MTRIICTFHAKTTPSRQKIVEALQQNNATARHAQGWVARFLQPMAVDIFRSDHGVADETLAAVALIDLPVGRFLGDYEDDVTSFCQSLQKEAAADIQLAVMHSRIFKPDVNQPVHYLYFMYKKTGLCYADYCDYYMNRHARFGIQTQGIGYVQNYIDHRESTRLAVQLEIKALTCDSISEMHFYSQEKFSVLNSVADMGATATEDEMRFVDRPQSSMVCLEPISLVGV